MRSPRRCSRSFGVCVFLFLVSGWNVFGRFIGSESFSPQQLGLEIACGAPVSGEYFRWWNVPSNFNNGAAARIHPLVRGTLTGAGTNGVDAVAESQLHLLVPPTQEPLVYDAAGRLKEDACWNYTWNGAGRLVGMTRKPLTLLDPLSTAEEVIFAYDADGRRTQKSRVVLYPGRQLLEHSRVLWSGWLPILEIQSRNGQETGRRWFQWGADISGTLEGAGGIGGLVAIIEEKSNGAVRTLLPVQDGLGNITAVIDAANGHTIARYEYGPFGKYLGESGDVDACPFRFQTKWYDNESEHYYFGYRYYDPRLGRWLSRDPLGEAGGFNLYAYCGNDPVNHHDPIGLADIPITLTDFSAITRPVLDSISGWFADREQIKKEKSLLKGIAVQNPELASAASTGVIGRVHSVSKMREEFFANSVLEADGRLPQGTADLSLLNQGRELGKVKAFSEAVLDVNLRDQQNFETPLQIGMAFVPLPFGKGRAAAGASLRVKVPRILSDPTLSTEELMYLTKEFRIKKNAILRAAERGTLKWSPGTDGVRIAELQDTYRTAVKMRFERRFKLELDLDELDADHMVDLVIGGSPAQRLKILDMSINRSVGASLLQSGRKAGLSPGDLISEIIFEPR